MDSGSIFLFYRETSGMEGRRTVCLGPRFPFLIAYILASGWFRSRQNYAWEAANEKANRVEAVCEEQATASAEADPPTSSKDDKSKVEG